MSKNTSVVLGKDQDKFIKLQIKSGRFTSVSEAMRAGLRLLQEQDLKIQALRSAIIKGEESGAATDFNMDEYLVSKRSNA